MKCLSYMIAACLSRSLERRPWCEVPARTWTKMHQTDAYSGKRAAEVNCTLHSQ